MAECLKTLLSVPSAPSFIYLHHPHHSSLSLPLPFSQKHLVKIDTIEHHTARLLLSGILLRLIGGDEDVGEAKTWDEFSLGLKRWWCDKMYLAEGKSKGKQTETYAKDEAQERSLVLVITHAERLNIVMGNNWPVIVRLAELTGVRSTVVLASSVPWDYVRPPRADAPEPLHVYLPSPSRDEIKMALLPASSHPLYPRFLDLLLSTILPLVTPPIEELHYLSKSLWPLYTSTLPPHYEMIHLGLSYPDPAKPPPKLAINVKLFTTLQHHIALPLASAVESLLPRQIGHQEFISALRPRPGKERALPRLPERPLPLAARLLLIAAYCASYNPSKTDSRLFGRGHSASGKRKKGGGTRRTGYGRVRMGKVPQRLLGPKPFPVDRLLSLFFAIYAEHAPRPAELEHLEDSSSDDEPAPLTWPPTIATDNGKRDRKRKREREQEQAWDDEVEWLMGSTNFWGMLPELEAQGLLKRVSPPDRLDNIMLRCEIDYETAKNLAKDSKLGFTLDDYLYEAIM
ncbi:origin recognition complex subunit 5 [Cryptococcus neoformans A1-35-8]|nr:origin recognition complex subunit 5 [Cryptococcus neoformans var. grubii A5-35-17]OXH20620.1 origin recognition complex subunit 5 [Cryptococcus neoformans var. grubii A1-35-8]